MVQITNTNFGALVEPQETNMFGFEVQGNIGATATCDFSAAPLGMIQVTVTEIVTGLTITPPTVAAGKMALFVLRLVNASHYAVTFVGVDRWVGTGVPDFTKATEDVVEINFRWDGTILEGIAVAEFYEVPE